jgi:hypothetical protein
MLTAGIRKSFRLPDNLLAWAIEPAQEDSVLIIPGKIMYHTVVITGNDGKLTSNQSVNIPLPAWSFHRVTFRCIFRIDSPECNDM